MCRFRHRLICRTTIKEIGELASQNNILFHTDAVQAYAHVPINIEECHIDMLSASGHKLNGPKGIGMLYIRTGVNIHPYIHGGTQENQLRAGTENVPGIVGFAKAAEIAFTTMEKRTRNQTILRDYIIRRILAEIPNAKVNGHPQKRLPNNINISLPSIKAESLLVMLNNKGICISTGSACASGTLKASHVLSALGLARKNAHGAIRLTIGEETTKEEIDYAIDTIVEITSHFIESR